MPISEQQDTSELQSILQEGYHFTLDEEDECSISEELRAFLVKELSNAFFTTRALLDKCGGNPLILREAVESAEASYQKVIRVRVPTGAYNGSEEINFDVIEKFKEYEECKECEADERKTCKEYRITGLCRAHKGKGGL